MLTGSTMKPTMKNIVTTYLKAIAFVKTSQDPLLFTTTCRRRYWRWDYFRDGYNSYRLI